MNVEKSVIIRFHRALSNTGMATLSLEFHDLTGVVRGKVMG